MGSAEHAYEYDLVTLGAGSGGVRASRISASHYGAKVAVVEMPFAFISSDTKGGAGGTCVIRGCVPKKLLVYGSSFAEHFEDARGFGWDAERPPFNWAKLIQSKGKEIERLNSVYNQLLAGAGVDYVEGRGSLIDAHTVEVALAGGGTKRLTAKNILIATGGKPVKLPIPGAEYGVTSDEALCLDEFPGKTVAVMGAGYIALEFSGIFRGMGADVHVFYRKPLPLTGFDEECRAQVAENLEGRGMHLHPGTNPVRIDKNADGTLTLVYKGEDGVEKSQVADVVMFGTGRKPYTKHMGFEKAGIAMDERSGAVVVDDFSRTNVPGIWAIGDVTNRLNLTPVAIMEGMAVAATAFGPTPMKPVYTKVPSAVFLQPPLATVGLTEEQAVEELCGPIDVYTSKFRPMRNILAGRQEKTFMKILVFVETNQVVGVHIVGPDSPEIIQGVAIALKCQATKAQFDATVGVHPSAAEEIVTMRTPTRRIEGRGCETDPDVAQPRDTSRTESLSNL